MPYLNPDIIASGIDPRNLDKASFQAGRILITTVKEKILRGESFAFESTLSGKTWYPILKLATEQGYQVNIYYLYLSKISSNIQRIKKRVKLGGHNIPNDVVYRRHPKCFKNFWDMYRHICQDWIIFDNSGASPLLVQSKDKFDQLYPHEQLKFKEKFFAGVPNGKK